MASSVDELSCIADAAASIRKLRFEDARSSMRHLARWRSPLVAVMEAELSKREHSALEDEMLALSTVSLENSAAEIVSHAKAQNNYDSLWEHVLNVAVAFIRDQVQLHFMGTENIQRCAGGAVC